MITVDMLVLGKRMVMDGSDQALVSPGLAAFASPVFPYKVPIAFAVRFVIEWADIDTPILFRWDILDEQGRGAAHTEANERRYPPLGHATAWPQFETQYVSMIVQTAFVEFREPGYYSLTVFIDDQEAAKTSIRVVQR